jgi:hypothetical protein
MAYKQRGFPMHSTGSVLKQTTDKPVITEESVTTKKPVDVFESYTPTEEEIANEPRKYKFAGASEWEKNPTTGEIRRVKKELTEKEIGQRGLFQQEIDALGPAPNPFMDPEGDKAYMEKVRAIRAKYGI